MTKGIKWKRAAVLVMICTLFITACGDFDAKGYAQAYLDAMFQGETDALMAFEEGSKQSELKEEYEEYIATFAEGLTDGLDVSEGMQIKFNALCKKYFVL